MQLVARRHQAAELVQHDAVVEVLFRSFLPGKGELQLVLDVVGVLGQRLQIVVDGRVPVLVLEGVLALVSRLLGGRTASGHDEHDCGRTCRDELISQTTVHECPPKERNRQSR